MDSSSPSSPIFNPLTLVSMADATDGIQSPQHKLVIKQVLQENIETITNSVLDEVIEHKYAGSGHLTEEWIETVTSYMTCLRGFIAQLRSETTPLTYQQLVIIVGTVFDIHHNVIKKEHAFELPSLECQHDPNRPFEKMNCELHRKIREMVQLAKSMFFLDLYTKSESATADFLRRKREVAAHIMIGNQRRMGQTSDDKLRSMMPAVADSHIQMVIEYLRKRKLITGDLSDLDQLVKVDAKEIGEKRMAEMVEMVGFLSQNGHSQKWKDAMLTKIEEARAFIQQNDLTFEMKEAIQHLNFQYYRMRNAYTKVMAAKAAPETFSVRPSDYH
ncbi:unnamed protein product [Caenorhabditis brenneri]